MTITQIPTMARWQIIVKTSEATKQTKDLFTCVVSVISRLTAIKYVFDYIFFFFFSTSLLIERLGIYLIIFCSVFYSFVFCFCSFIACLFLLAPPPPTPPPPPTSAPLSLLLSRHPSLFLSSLGSQDTYRSFVHMIFSLLFSTPPHPSPVAPPPPPPPQPTTEAVL